MIRISSDPGKKTATGNRFSSWIFVLFLFLILIISGVTANPIAAAEGASATPQAQYLSVTAVPSSAMEWTQATGQAQFSRRQGQTTVVYNNKLWVIGGWAGDYSCAGNSCYSDVWSSDDGVQWIRETEHAAFSARAGHRSVVFDDKMWVIRGRNLTSLDPLNDVWYSSDGIHWTCAVEHAPFVPRWEFGVTVFNGEIWVIGGSKDGPVYNDVWHSPDGINWMRATEHAGFSPRMDLTATTFNGNMWVTGGFDWSKHFNDLWFSKNGVTWTKVTDHAPYPARRYHKTEVADGKMWLIGGIGGNDPYNWKYLTDVWYTPDGTDWIQATADAGFPGRYSFTTATFDNKIWVIAGTSGGDIWYSGDFDPSDSSDNVSISSSATTKNQSAKILVTKTISPASIKQGTNAKITITILNKGPLPVHDIEILDTMQQEFPVTDGITRYSAQMIEPNDSKILTYTVHATKAGSFRLNRTTVMYADQDGNYRLTYSNFENVRVLPSLIGPSPDESEDNFIQDLIAWINGFDPFA